MKNKNILCGLKITMSLKMSQEVCNSASNAKKIVNCVPSSSTELSKRFQSPVVKWKKPPLEFEDFIPASITSKLLSKAKQQEQKSTEPTPLFNKVITKSGGKKKIKKKKRFRNMDGDDDDDDDDYWPSASSMLQSSKTYPSPLSPLTTSTQTKSKEKIQILQEFIFPSPSAQSTSGLTVINKLYEKLNVTAEKIEDGHLSDDSVSSIHSKMSAISDFNLNGSLETVTNESMDISKQSVQGSHDNTNIAGNGDNVEEEETVVVQVLQNGEAIDTINDSIFCTYDDEGNLICLQKTESGELILLPTEQIQEGENAEAQIQLNNDSFVNDDNHKEDNQRLVERLLEEEKEEELLRSPERQSEGDDTGDVEMDEDLLLDEDMDITPCENVKPTVDVPLTSAENDESSGTLPETVENIGNEEIIADAKTPEEEISLSTPPLAATDTEPIYILNEPESSLVNTASLADIANIDKSNATPLELAFVSALQSFAPSSPPFVQDESNNMMKSKSGIKIVEAQIPPETEVISQLETLLQKQDQCRIVDYVPTDDSDIECIDDSINNVNNLSQMDIVRMVLGEGVGAVLVSDQEQAVELLELPPDYEQKPIVSVSIAPLAEVVDNKAVEESPVKKKVGKLKKIGKKLGVTSTPLQKGKKKQSSPRIPISKHVTGDCNVSPIKLPVTTASDTKSVEGDKEKKLNGSYFENSFDEALSKEFNLKECTISVNSTRTDKLASNYSANSSSNLSLETSIIKSKPKYQYYKGKRQRKYGRRNKVPKGDDNNSSKENNNSLLESNDEGTDKSSILVTENLSNSTTGVTQDLSVLNWKDDSLRSDISLGESSMSSEDIEAGEMGEVVKVKKKKSRRKKERDTSVDLRVTRSSKIGLPEVAQVNLSNSEVTISMTQDTALAIPAVMKEEDDDDVQLIETSPKQEPIDVDAQDDDRQENADVGEESLDAKHGEGEKQLSGNETTPAVSNGELLISSNVTKSVTPKSTKKSKAPFQFKINFKNLMNNAKLNAPLLNKKHKHKRAKDKNRSVSPEVQYNSDIKIKDEPIDDDMPKVPKIILKLSPHNSPSIVRSPSSSPKKRSKSQERIESERDKLNDTPHTKTAVKKRKVLSPVTSDNSLVIRSPKGKKRKVNLESDEIKEEEEADMVPTRSQPLISDDPELIINLPLTTEESNEDTENLDIKVDIKKEEMDLYTLDSDPLKVGDLILGRLSSFSYWPCMVTIDPEKQVHWRPIKQTLSYHVRFFGDNGRRAWIHRSSIIRFNGPDTLEKHMEILKEKKKTGVLGIDIKTFNRNMAACKIGHNMKATWDTGMLELAALDGKTVQEKHEFFFNMFSRKNRKAQKRKRQLTESADGIYAEIKEELKQALTPTDKQSPSKFVAKKRKLEDKKPSISIVPKKIAKSAAGRRYSSRSSKSTSCATSPISKLPDTTKDYVEQKRNYVDEDLELIIKGSMTKFEIDEKEIKDERDEDVIRKWRPLSGNGRGKDKDSRKGRNGGDGASEVSDTDSSSKISVQSSGNKRILFKDVPRRPVCHVCFKGTGTVLKCKGTCFAFYHPECCQLQSELKEEEEVPVFGSPKTTATSPKTTLPDVEIVTVKTKSKYLDKNPVNLNDSDLASDLDLFEQLDNKLSKVMAPLTATTTYGGSTTEEDNPIEINKDEVNKESILSFVDDFVCISCKHNIEPPCFACGSTVYMQKHLDRYRCAVNGCGKYFHRECLKYWPQSVVNNAVNFSFKCPMHHCQTCNSDNPRASTSAMPMSKIVRCLKCPASYEANSFCIPAGTEILSFSQIICPRHVQHKTTKRYTINANWCFICAKGGDLMCCETCPTSCHADCISINLRDDDTFVCDDCESGRLPLYDEIVWAKFAHFKWWPAVILFPEDIPENVRNFPHNKGEFVVRFYGTHDHHWFALGRVFLFQEDDDKDGASIANRKDHNFKKAVDEAKTALVFKKELKLQRDQARWKADKPPPYTKIRINRIIGNAKPSDLNVSNTNTCNCNPGMFNPCGPYSDCLNRLLMTECDPEVCPAKDKCNNQRFEKRLYPPLLCYKTESRGWGLKSTEPIEKGQFIIEYVGEVIDQEEYHKRMAMMNERKAENYYFLTLDSLRTIDAGPKGNLARFMNHCCKPNCVTQKWTVKGDTRVGLFAAGDIPADTELTFNYHMEATGDTKEVCRCGADNCSGFLGAKNKEPVKIAKDNSKVTKAKKKAKKLGSGKKQEIDGNLQEFVPCFICGQNEAEVDCSMKNCGKSYHIKCLELATRPSGKWTCPKHYCNTCAKRTIRSCLKCLESYCPMHSHGNVQFHASVGYVCNKHNPDTTPPSDPNTISPQTSTKSDSS